MFSFVRTNRQTDSHNKDKQLNVLKGASKTNPSALSFFFYKTLRKVSSFWTVCRLIYIENSGFWEGILAQIPGARRGFLKSPRARRAARGDFKNPRTGDGDLGKIPDQKPEFCTYFFLIPVKNLKISCLPWTACSLVCVIFFLSFRRKEFYKNVSFYQLVYSLQRTHL